MRLCMFGLCVPIMPMLWSKSTLGGLPYSVKNKMASEELPGWTTESRAVLQRHADALIPDGWVKLLTSVGRERNKKLFTLNHPEVGATFEYVVFFSSEQQKTITVVQFGPKTEGPEGYVHGGAIATIGDACAGIFLYTGLKLPVVTANLNVEYKKPLPLGSTVIIETSLDRVEGRKYFTTSTIKSPDGTQLYDRVTCLFMTIRK